MYLVTGGAGFIGSNIVDALVSRGEKVRVLDDFSTGRRDNLAAFTDKIEVLQGDIADAAICARAVQGVRFVLHQAALPSVARSMEDPLSTNKTNVHGTLSLLWAAKIAKVERFVYASSSSVYGESPTLPKQEDMPPRPISPYAVSKLTTEYYASVFTQAYQLPTVGLRYFNVFGPRQDPNSHYAAVIPRFITSILAGRAPTIFGDGAQSRDFCFIENVVSANLLACTSTNAVGQVMNIACGSRIDLNELVQKINLLLNTNIVAIHEPTRTGDIKHSLADIERAQRLLGYQVLADFDEGLRRTVAWYQRAEAPQ
jgi:nucleoside-diphosphate-sugar epimerase